MPNLVYILTNPTMPDLVKIGKTDNIERRLKELTSSTGVPVAFECFYCGEVDDNDKVESNLHIAFGDHRINAKREFFRISAENVKAALEIANPTDRTPQKDITDNPAEQEALDKARKRRSVFTFSMADIPFGAELTFIKDETKIAKVVDDKKVEYEGENYSLTGLAKALLKDDPNSKGAFQYIHGQLYFKYNGDIVNDIRIRLEDEQTD